MKIKCPDIKDRGVNETVTALKSLTPDIRLVHAAIMQNNGHGFEKAPNGEPSQLLPKLEEVITKNGFSGSVSSRTAAYHLKAKVLGKTGRTHREYVDRLIADKQLWGKQLNDFIDSNGELTITYLLHHTDFFQELGDLRQRARIMYYDVPEFYESKEEFVSLFMKDFKYLIAKGFIADRQEKISKDGKTSSQYFVRSTNDESLKLGKGFPGKQSIINANKRLVETHFKKMNSILGRDVFNLVPYDLRSKTQYYVDIDNSGLEAAYTDRILDMKAPEGGLQYSKIINEDINNETETLEKTNSKIQKLTNAFPNAQVIIDGDMPSDTFGSIEYVDGLPVIRLNSKGIQSDTVIHEFGHLFIDMLGGSSNPFIKKGMDSLRGSKIESDVMKAYPELTGEALNREILSTAIGIEGAKLENQSPFRRWVTIFFNKLRLLFGIKENVALELARRMLNNEVNSSEFVNSLPNYIQYSKVQNTTEPTSLQDKKLKQATAKILERVQIFKNKYKKTKDIEFKKDIEDLLTDLTKAKDAQGIVRYIDEVEKLSERVLNSLKKISLDNIDGQLLTTLHTTSGVFDLINEVEELLLVSEKESLNKIQEYIKLGYITANDTGGYTIVDNISDDKKAKVNLDLGIVFSLAAKKNSLATSAANIKSIDTHYKLLSQEFMVAQMAPNTTAIKSEYKENYIKEFNNSYGGRKAALNTLGKDYNTAREQYVTDKLSSNSVEIEAATKEHVRNILATVPQDLGGLSSWISDPKNQNNALIQFVTKALEEADYKAYRTYTDAERDADIIFEEYQAYKGKTLNMEEFYSELLERDSKGNLTGYMVGEYLSSGSEFVPILNPQYDKIRTLKRTEPNHPLVKMYDYLTDLSAKRDLALPLAYRLGKEFVAGTDAQGTITVKTYKLPSIEKGAFERISEQGFGTYFVEGLKDLYQRDTSYTESGEQLVDGENNIQTDKAKFKKVIVDEAGRERQTIPIHFRANIKDKGQQSFDLMGITLADFHMASNYKEKAAVRHIAEIALDVAANADIAQRVGRTYKVNYLSKDNTPITKPGTTTNMFKSLNSIVQQKLYGITSVDMGDTTILGKQVSWNKLANGVMKWTGDTMLVGNTLSAGVNLVQGKVFNFIEGFSGGYYSRDNIMIAEKLYLSNMKDIVDDAAGKRISVARTNLFIEKFNAFSSLESVGKKFAHSNRITRLTNSGTLHFLNNSVEHYIQSTVMYAVLDSITIPDASGKLIPLHEAYEIKGNKLVVKDGITISLEVEAQVSSRIKEVTKQIHGNYDATNLAMLQRYVGGKFVFMLRKWLVTGVQRRWLGISNVNVNREDLQAEDKFYSEFLQQDVEGYYTTAIRFVYSLRKDLLKLRLDLVSNNWHELTDAERANIRKTIMEATFIVLTLIATKLLAGLAKDADDEDKEDYYRYAYLFRRLHGESTFYLNPMETLKIMSSPAASISMLQNVGKVTQQLYEDPFERYEVGNRKGELKLKKRVFKLVPVLSQVDKDIMEIYEWLERN